MIHYIAQCIALDALWLNILDIWKRRQEIIFTPNFVDELVSSEFRMVK
jgi:hypothetical protein